MKEQILGYVCVGQALASISDKEDVEISVSFYELYKAFSNLGRLWFSVLRI